MTFEGFRFKGFEEGGFGRVLVLLLVLVSLGLASCERRPLEEEWQSNGYAEILLITDWEKLLPYETPTGLTAIFYPTAGGNPVTVMSNNTYQNVVRLGRGKYDVLVFNQSIYEFGSMTFTDMNAFATACANLNPLTAGNTLTAADYKWLSQVLSSPDSVALGMREPEYFHADRFQYEVTEELCMRQFYKENGVVGVDVPVWDVPTAEEYVDTIFSTPPPVPPTLYARVRVKGLNNVHQVRAYITDMARADRFGPHVNTDESALHVISNWGVHANPGDKTRGIIEGSVRCFGLPTQIVTHNDFNHLVTDQLAGAPSSKAVVDHRSPSKVVMDHWTPDERRPHTLIDYGRNILYLEVLLRDGKTHCTFAFDVTDRIIYTEEELRLDIVLEIGDYPGAIGGDDDYPIVLPDVPDVIGSGGAGFDATVEDWKNEDHTIYF